MTSPYAELDALVTNPRLNTMRFFGWGSRRAGDHEPIGAVILNYGNTDDTLACLNSLRKSGEPRPTTIVVDNGPDDDEHQALKKRVGHKATVIATGSNLGYAEGNNIGIARLLESDASYILVINPDAEVKPGTVATLAKHLDDDPTCGVVGPRVLTADQPPLVWSDGGVVDPDRHGATYHLSSAKPPNEVTIDPVADVDYITGAALLVRREVFNSAGLLPTEYFLYFEETDWCQRVRRAGWRVMVNRRAEIVHHKRSSGVLPQPYYLYYMTRNRYRFAQTLGFDPEAALDDLERTFVDAWRKKVKKFAPDWLDQFELIVNEAKTDARQGRFGRNDAVASWTPPILKPKTRAAR